MQAIIQIGSDQFRVEKGAEISIKGFQGAVGDTITNDQVLLLREKDSVAIGTPVIKGAKVKLKVKKQTKANKVVALQFKKGQGNQTRTGSREHQTVVEVTDIKK